MNMIVAIIIPIPAATKPYLNKEGLLSPTINPIINGAISDPKLVAI